MNQKTQFIKWDIEEYKRKIISLNIQIKKLEETKEMWRMRLRNKLRELK